MMKYKLEDFAYDKKKYLKYLKDKKQKLVEADKLCRALWKEKLREECKKQRVLRKK